MTHPRRRAALLAVVVCLAATLGGLRSGNANEEPAPKAKASALDTDIVPDDSLAVISVHVAELWKHPLSKAFRANMGKELSEALKQTRLGVELGDVDRLTVFLPSNPVSYEPLIVAATEKPYDKKVVLTAAAPEAKELTRNGRSYYFSDDRRVSFCFFDDHRFLVGSPRVLIRFLDNGRPPKNGPMAAVLKKVPEHFAVAAVDIANLDRMARLKFWSGLRECYYGLYAANFNLTRPVLTEMPPHVGTPPFEEEPASITTLVKGLRFAELSMDLDKEVRVNLDLTYASKEDAANGAPAGDDALDVLRGAFAQEKQGQAAAPETSLRVLAFLNDVQAALRKVKVEQNTAVVEVRGTLKIDADATAGALIDGLDEAMTPDGARDRVRIPNDLKKLYYAVFWCMQSDGRRLPAAAIYDNLGKPLLSWRVRLLPYIGQDALYKEFHLDEPWDSEHNKKLLEKMPEIFALNDTQACKDHETHIQAFVGPGTAFDPPRNPQPGATPNGVGWPGGLNATILFVEAKKAVPWTKPEDIPFDDGKLLPKVGRPNKNGFFAVTCDGPIYFIPLTVKEETLRTWVKQIRVGKKPDLDK